MASTHPLNSHSYSNLNEVTFQHLNWVIALDFASQQLKGYAEYTFHHSSTSKPAVVVLDTHHLNVSNAFVDGKETTFTLAEDEHPVFGRALAVTVPSHATKIRVDYTTTAASSGLQWLSKELTAGKTHPYLFTQCQAIHARTIVPCPDTPGCKFTYSATVTVPDWCTCLMSAIADAQGRKNHNNVDNTYQVSFQQTVPIPSYLLAIVAGKLESVDLGPRSRVWAEPTVVTKAAHEFAQTEAFLQHAEEITGQEYVWKRYDLVCLPPSFPYGGMENPCLTFVTPTLLAGDRSLADVVAHEISHSWTGNLVTNRSWTDFWLNEGWTMWLERKIQTRIAQDPKAYDLKATMGLRDLVESVEEFGPKHPYTALVPNTDGIDPDEVFSSIPYEKGFNFLHFLSTVVGGHAVFDKFAQAYIQEFKFKTVTSGEFRVFFEKYFADKPEALRKIDWDTWFHSPGMPPVANKFDTTLTSQATKLGEQMANNSDPNTWTSASKNALKKWPASLWILMLDTLLLKQEGANFTTAHLDAIDAFTHNHLSTTHNSELRFRWFTLALRSGDLRMMGQTVEFLKEQGRMKFVRPLFRDLCISVGAAQASIIFADCKSLYHPIAAKMIQRDIENSAAKAKGKKVKFASPSPVAQWLGVSDEVVGYATVAVAIAAVALIVVARRRMNMNMDPNAMSPWFTAPENEYPSMNPQQQHPNSNNSNSGFHSSGPGSTGGLSGTVGSSNGGYYDDQNEDEFANEPPLLEELGINFEHIWAKTVSVLLPTKQINEHILDDADLAGPLVFCFLFGMCLLLAAKVHFGYIYGFGVLSCLFMYLLMNLLSPERTIDIYRVCSVLGYCLLPIIGLAAINIVVSVKNLGLVGFLLASVCTLWSTHTASRFFEKALYMTEQKYLVMYPTMLVYACFVLIAVF
ncbi:hypothetical protein BBJ29_005317 [Phytophthora kernoviae]|uniref:Peptidase M1 leukotriene A4 hydrolase/aminopeptidase C-terminal domain-containing protein n=1 Tax=Phytophthora kernoviae TaxID=325452 RepID=A0A421FVU2_9STRA|nr:hypothetical protein BBJ29_005317 [Phytophthora kernoviae]